MFDGIARRYDFLNHLLSLGRDIRWRRKAVRLIPAGPALRVLDLCGGTGDFLGMLRRRIRPLSGDVLADFSRPMLALSRPKFARAPEPVPALVQMDALLPAFRPQSFDVVLCGFGMRNLDSLVEGVWRIHELLRPGGLFITLEFFRPDSAFTRFFYGAAAPLAIPVLGLAVSGRGDAYRYLVDSVHAFVTVEAYRECLQSAGFRVEGVWPCDLGIAHIILASKGATEDRSG